MLSLYLSTQRRSATSCAQHVLLHLAAVKMEERHRRVMAQRPGSEALFEDTQHVPGHRMQVGQRLRADLDPDEFDEFGVGMDHPVDAMGDRGGVRGEEARVKALDPAGWRDRARDQEQS